MEREEEERKKWWAMHAREEKPEPPAVDLRAILRAATLRLTDALRTRGCPLPDDHSPDHPRTFPRLLALLIKLLPLTAPTTPTTPTVSTTPTTPTTPAAPTTPSTPVFSTSPTSPAYATPPQTPDVRPSASDSGGGGGVAPAKSVPSLATLPNPFVPHASTEELGTTKEERVKKDERVEELRRENWKLRLTEGDLQGQLRVAREFKSKMDELLSASLRRTEKAEEASTALATRIANRTTELASANNQLLDLAEQLRLARQENQWLRDAAKSQTETASANIATQTDSTQAECRQQTDSNQTSQTDPAQPQPTKEMELELEVERKRALARLARGVAEASGRELEKLREAMETERQKATAAAEEQRQMQTEALTLADHVRRLRQAWEDEKREQNRTIHCLQDRVHQLSDIAHPPSTPDVAHPPSTSTSHQPNNVHPPSTSHQPSVQPIANVSLPDSSPPRPLPPLPNLPTDAQSLRFNVHNVRLSFYQDTL